MRIDLSTYKANCFAFGTFNRDNAVKKFIHHKMIDILHITTLQGIGRIYKVVIARADMLVAVCKWQCVKTLSHRIKVVMPTRVTVELVELIEVLTWSLLRGRFIANNLTIANRSRVSCAHAHHVSLGYTRGLELAEVHQCTNFEACIFNCFEGQFKMGVTWPRPRLF